MILQVTAYVVHRKDVEQYRHYPQDALDKMYYAKEIKCAKLLYDYDQAALKMDRLKSELQQVIMPLLRSDRLIQIACFQLKDGFDLYDGMLIKELVALNGQFLRVIAYKGEQSLNVQSSSSIVVKESSDTVDVGDSSTKTKQKKSKKKRQKIAVEDTAVPKQDDVVHVPSPVPIVQQSSEDVKGDGAEVDAELQKKLAKKERKRKRKLEQEQEQVQVQAEEPKVATGEKSEEAPKAKRKKEKKSKSSKPVHTPTPTPLPQEQPQQSMFVMVSDEDVSPQIAISVPDVNESVAQVQKVTEKPEEMDINQPSLEQSSNDNEAPTHIQNVDEQSQQESPPITVEEPQIEMEVEQAPTEDCSATTAEENAPFEAADIAGDTVESLPVTVTEKEATETPVPVINASVIDGSSRVDTTDQEEAASHETADHGDVINEDDQFATKSVDVETPQTPAQEVSAQKEVVSSPTQLPLDVSSDSSDDDSSSSDSTTSTDDDEEDNNVASKINTGGNTLRVSFPNEASTPITLPVQLNSTSSSITKLPTLSDIKFSFPPVTVAQSSEQNASSKIGIQNNSTAAPGAVKASLPVSDKKSEESDDENDDGMSLLLKQQQKAVTPPASQQKKRVKTKKVKDQPAPVKQK
ncbi:hypothetical protein MP228_001667 [Amoeboaphelidium protococcarum]|nr:hypothetical protein MP228_001667 [Amoeboaphelidium protococcarum]